MAPIWHLAIRGVALVVTGKAYGSDVVFCHKGLYPRRVAIGGGREGLMVQSWHSAIRRFSGRVTLGVTGNTKRIDIR